MGLTLVFKTYDVMSRKEVLAKKFEKITDQNPRSENMQISF